MNANIRGGMGRFQLLRNYGSWIYADPEIIPIDSRLLGGGLIPGLILHSFQESGVGEEEAKVHILTPGKDSNIWGGVQGRERSSGVPISDHFLRLLCTPKA